ncbi:MAG: hypothetical protein WC511_02260 [Candidatus Pacearchaeota archaeon]
MLKTYRAAKLAADLKDNYIQLLEEGYKPEEIDKFVKDINTKNPSEVKSPTPSGSGMGKIPAIGSEMPEGVEDKEDEAYLATTFDPMMGGKKKNPEPSKNVEDLKKNDFSKKASETKEDIDYLAGK